MLKCFKRRVEEFFDFGEGDNLVEFPVDLPLAHSQNRAAQVNIFAAGQLGMKPRAHFQQASHAAMKFGEARCRVRDPGENLQQRGLARAVAPDQADDFPALRRQS